jgi:hypothetical protein
MTTHPAHSIPHTPGPWATKSTGDYQEIHPVNNKFFTIAKVTGFDSHEAKANARLISAVPELLSALEDIAQDLENNGEIYGTDDARLGRIYAAIAKAKGE